MPELIGEQNIQELFSFQAQEFNKTFYKIPHYQELINNFL